MQPGAFFLPFVLIFLISNTFIWLRIAMQLVAGFSMFALARELGLGRLSALIAGILFELNGTFALTPGPDSVYCAAAFLPLLLLGLVQTAKREREHTGTLWIALESAIRCCPDSPRWLIWMVCWRCSGVFVFLLCCRSVGGSLYAWHGEDSSDCCLL